MIVETRSKRLLAKTFDIGFLWNLFNSKGNPHTCKAQEYKVIAIHLMVSERDIDYFGSNPVLVIDMAT